MAGTNYWAGLSASDINAAKAIGGIGEVYAWAQGEVQALEAANADVLADIQALIEASALERPSGVSVPALPTLGGVSGIPTDFTAPTLPGAATAGPALSDSDADAAMGAAVDGALTEAAAERRAAMEAAAAGSNGYTTAGLGAILSQTGPRQIAVVAGRALPRARAEGEAERASLRAAYGQHTARLMAALDVQSERLAWESWRIEAALSEWKAGRLTARQWALFAADRTRQVNEILAAAAVAQVQQTAAHVNASVSASGRFSESESAPA